MNEFRLDPERLDFTLVGSKNDGCYACSIKSQEVAAIPFGNGFIRSYEIKNDIQPSKYELNGGVYKSSNAHGYQEIMIENAEHKDKIKSYSAEQLNVLIDSFMKRAGELSRHKLGDNLLITRYLGGHGYTELSILPVPKLVKSTCFECAAAASVQNRELISSENFIAFSPFAPRFEEEIQILPRKHLDLLSMDPVMTFDLAGILKKIIGAIGDDSTMSIIQSGGSHLKVLFGKSNLTPYSIIGINKIYNSPEEYVKSLKAKINV